ncbi:MAG: tripartite tricarboxylate transporter TctB family protein [Geminicoccaceae bacterium]
MTLERWIGLLFLLFSCVYGYTAYFGMDHLLPPILQRAPVWPSSFPKMLSLVGIIVALAVIFTTGPANATDSAESGIDYRKLHEYKLGQALALIGAMVAYALLLRPIGFIAATTLFLAGGSFVLGERRFHLMIPIAVTGTVLVWYLVQEILGIFLSPWPRLF